MESIKKEEKLLEARKKERKKFTWQFKKLDKNISPVVRTTAINIEAQRNIALLIFVPHKRIHKGNWDYRMSSWTL